MCRSLLILSRFYIGDLHFICFTSETQMRSFKNSNRHTDVMFCAAWCHCNLMKSHWTDLSRTTFTALTSVFAYFPVTVTHATLFCHVRGRLIVRMYVMNMWSLWISVHGMSPVQCTVRQRFQYSYSIIKNTFTGQKNRKRSGNRHCCYVQLVLK